MSINLRDYPAIRYAKDLEQICQPLEELANIDYFAHVRVDKKGQFCALGKNPEFVAHYLENQYYNADVHLVKNGLAEEYVIQDNVEHISKTKTLFDDCERFSLQHIFTVIYRDEKFTNAYHFATSEQQAGFNEVYLRNLPLLKKFIQQFNSTVQENKFLSQAYNISFQIEMGDAAYHSKYVNHEIITEPNLAKSKRYYLNNSDVYLTQREVDVLQMLHQGKAAPEIASLLFIAECTVREHICKIKSKLKCKTFFQLGEMFTKLF